MKKDIQKCSKQKNLKKGFTLVELLVVVLIIGILAAIALPQYRKAVVKAKLAEVDVMMNTVKKNIQIYLDANGYPIGKTIMFTGVNRVGDIEIPADCDTDNYCNNDLMNLYASCSEYCHMCPNIKNWIGGEMGLQDCILEMWEPNVWYINDKLAESESVVLKNICPYFKERHYPGTEGAVTACASVGVALQEYKE